MEQKDKEEVVSFLKDMKKEESKKYVCFICSQEFPNYVFWKNHIKDKHEINKDYLLCPECDVPCRDLKTHYLRYHKKVQIPQDIPLRVEKMFDWTQKYSRDKKKKNKWKQGVFDSIKMGKQITYRSSWERDVMICLEKCVDVIEYYGDNYLCIPYSIKGSTHRYWPDFTIKMKNNKTFIIEIKPIDQVTWEINQYKWKSAVAYCLARQWEFQVWTQKHIRKIKTRAVRNDILFEEHLIPSKEEVLKEISIN